MMIEINKVYNVDCLEGMKLIKDESVDLILTDPPYNVVGKQYSNPVGGSKELWENKKGIINLKKKIKNQSEKRKSIN